MSINLADLDTPQWWLGRYGFEFSDTGYRLDKTMGFAWVNSLQSPVDTPSHVRLTDIRLEGTDTRYRYLTLGLCASLWIAFVLWQLSVYVQVLTRELQVRVKQDQPLIAYKKLSIAPQKDKEKSALLRYLATGDGSIFLPSRGRFIGPGHIGILQDGATTRFSSSTSNGLLM